MNIVVDAHLSNLWRRWSIGLAGLACGMTSAVLLLR